MSDETHIEVRGLTLAYGTFTVQRDLNFSVRRGDVFIIMGPSGCGKSTLLKAKNPTPQHAACAIRLAHRLHAA